ncbi:class I SAM-dependent methyltransferase [Hyphomicrobium sp. CS1GBMeth3]|uniref:class I SAM-dependent methyltransferase n=1 Tax=Hyphomicrobium sp. CS1GBMeth3 TaxID=1892845 RepID=UPI0009302FD4|nr:class I SAM-dependent methyltransferase [Hyphomicrobium sp. CS1GBMeth3]
MKCRHCHRDLSLQLVDLGSAPPSNAYLTAAALAAPEKWYPLRVLVCDGCWLAQTEDFAGAHELFAADYAYFSSFSASWLEHSRRYVDAVIERFALSPQSHVVEVAANDGYLLQYVKARGVSCLGIEPTASTAEAARAKGLPIIEEFFGRELAARLHFEGRSADLMIANNVLAHVPDINDFVSGFAELLKPQGVVTFEFPSLVRLIEGCQFDTIYHEHFSYLSLTAAECVLAANGLRLFDVEELPTHGGSLRLFAERADTGAHDVTERLAAARDRERAAGVESAAFYTGFQARTEAMKDGFLGFLLDARRDGVVVAGYGAAAKGNTLLNYAGVRPDLVRFVVDRNPAKQGRFLPGSRIPVVAEEELRKVRPGYIVIFPWNLRDELIAQLGYAREWGARFVTAVPALEVR